MRVIIIIAAMVGLSGCDPVERPREITSHITSKGSDRFDVSVVCRFRDDDAYHNYRTIFSIRDTITGQEYIGISGVGISEAGSHQTGSGKQRHTIEDER